MRKRIVLAVLLVAMVAALVPVALPMTAHAVEGQGDVTRSEWVQELVAVFQMTVEENNYPDNYFSDLSGQEEYYRDILVAVEFGVIDLEAGLPFDPDEPATREFAAQTLNDCLGFQIDENVTYTFSDLSDVSYPDHAQLALNRQWFKLINGAFMPEQPITKQEMNRMMSDAKQVLSDSVIDENYDSTYVFSDEVIEFEDAVAEINADGTVSVITGTTSVEQGDIFVIYVQGIPFAYRAESVRVDENVSTITVTELELNTYLVSADAEGIMQADLAQFEVADGLEAVYLLEDGSRVRSAAERGTLAIEAIYISKKIESMTISVELTNLQLEYRTKADLGKVDASAVVTGNCTVSGTIPFGNTGKMQ